MGRELENGMITGAYTYGIDYYNLGGDCPDEYEEDEMEDEEDDGEDE